MKAPLHGHNLLATGFANYQTTGMTFNRRHRKMWYLIVRYGYSVFKRIGELTKS
jgi:hypothetical protein